MKPTQNSDRAKRALERLCSANNQVGVRSRETLLQKLEILAEGGREQLHVISDFDMTLTRYWYAPGERNKSSHGLLEDSGKATPESRAFFHELFQTYYPIEVSPNFTREEKIPKMIEWWERSHDAIVALQVTPADLRSMAAGARLAFRDGVTDLVDLLETLGVPLLVFSAGIYDVIYHVLQAHNLKRSMVHLISNRMRYAAAGAGESADGPAFGRGDLAAVPDTAVCVGFSEPIIHVFNKSEAALSSDNAAYFGELRARRNVLLLGDSLGDLDMARGVEHRALLTVGFLNHDEDTHMADYLDKFDIVLTGDQGVGAIMQLVQDLVVS